MIRALDVDAGNAAEKAMGHQPALDLVPDLGETRVEFLSNLLLFHKAWYALSDRRPMETRGRQMARRPRASDEEMAAIPMHPAARSVHRHRPTGMRRRAE